MGFTASHRAILDIIDGELLETSTARDIVRKAGARGATESTGTVATGGILSNFPYLDSQDGYVLDYPSGVSAFPDGTSSMSHYLDVTGVSAVRLLYNIRQGGGPDVILSVEGLGAEVSLGLMFIAGAPDIVFGDWTPISVSGAVLIRWRVSAPSSGSAILGLCQLQGR